MTTNGLCLFGFKYPHVVNRKDLWEDGIVNALLSTPGSANGQIQDQVVGFVKGPDIEAGMFVFKGEVLLVIHKEIDLLGSPLHGIYVKRLIGPFLGIR